MLRDEKVKLKIIEKYLKGDGNFVTLSKEVGLGPDAVRRFINKLTYRSWWDKNPELAKKVEGATFEPVVNFEGKHLSIVRDFLNGKSINRISKDYKLNRTRVQDFIKGTRENDKQWWAEHPEEREAIDEVLATGTHPKTSSTLNDKQLTEIVNIYERSKGEIPKSELGRMYGVSTSTISRFLDRETYKEWWAHKYKPLASGEIKDPYANIEEAKSSRFIVTSAQNNTYVHEKFFKSIEVAAEYLDAEILIGTFSYNRNGFQNLGKGEGDWFDDRIVKYIKDEPVKLADGLIWCGELNILPTAVNPLSGFQTYAGGGSGIIPHTKMVMESYPTIETEDTRFMYTTGTVTQRNYIEKTAGQKASFHHIFGALLVEVDEDGVWFVRQLSADNDTGTFQDLDVMYTPEGVMENQTIEGINWGDVHADAIDRRAAWASFMEDNPQNILDVLKPKYQFVHDVFDMRRRNHHNKRDYHYLFNLFHRELDNVEGEVQVTAEVIEEMSRDFSELVVVNSNHDRALQGWLNESCYRTDFTNSIYFLRLQLEVYKAIERGDNNFSVFEYAIREKLSKDDIAIRFLKLDESFIICDNGTGSGIECGMHGDLGANGSRGSVGGFRRVGSRINVGHSHSCRIMEGVYQSGTLSLLKMGYNKGPSSWSHSHIITYPNGKRTIITIKDGRWRKW